MGTLFVIAAASGTGKTTLARALVERTPGLLASVSHTTRAPRPAERDGTDYHFVTPAVFEAMRQRGEFAECAEVFGHHYGTHRASVSEALAAGQDLVLVIDWQGHRQLRSAFAQTVGVFLLPPSRQELERRLRGRGQDPAEVVRQRLARARAEIAHWPEFDYLVVNRDFEAALADLQAIVRGRRLGRDAQAGRQAGLLRELLEEDRQSR
jgi:guanylate kinase